ncbi:ribonuclease HI family protein [Massilia terrae]|uniref:Ribonuclease HI family protein n=1 Tax=Massilia terrae TaxID=1811224 RepID=A0ABT2CUL6_9BURK|nr:ribonuclease HI family protein [Massilia terrae]MCS0657676.1 ribonuclease HI family protein [Massilia terrae]
MNELYELAYRRERSASRRLARQTGMTHEQALRTTLEQQVGDAGLAQLVAERRALAQAEARRIADRRAARATNEQQRKARHLAGPGTWNAWFDGSARPNPGRCAIGAVLNGPDGQVVEISEQAGYGNSGEAEYRALIALLRAAVAYLPQQLTIHGDSQVVIDDVNGPEDAAAQALLAYRREAHALLAQLPEVTLRWVPRHRNQQADALSQRAGLGSEAKA